MANLLSTKVIEAIHEELTSEHPMTGINLGSLYPYYQAGDYIEFIGSLNIVDWTIETTALMLILAAEDEFGGYLEEENHEEV